MMAGEYVLYRPFAVTFSVASDLTEPGGYERACALIKQGQPDGPLDGLTVVMVEPTSIRLRCLLEDKGTVEEQLTALEEALCALGFPGRDGWEP